MFSRSSLIDSGDNLHINNLLLSPSPPLVLNSHHMDNSEQARPEPKDSWIGTCLTCHFFEHSELATLTGTRLNFIHFDTESSKQDISLPFMRVLVTPAVYPRLFDFLTTAQQSHCVTNIDRHLIMSGAHVYNRCSFSV